MINKTQATYLLFILLFLFVTVFISISFLLEDIYGVKSISCGCKGCDISFNTDGKYIDIRCCTNAQETKKEILINTVTKRKRRIKRRYVACVLFIIIFTSTLLIFLQNLVEVVVHQVLLVYS